MRYVLILVVAVALISGCCGMKKHCEVGCTKPCCAMKK